MTLKEPGSVIQLELPEARQRARHGQRPGGARGQRHGAGVRALDGAPLEDLGGAIALSLGADPREPVRGRDRLR